MTQPAAPPTPQEIHRKLSMHAPTPPTSILNRRKSQQPPLALSGTESDSDGTSNFSSSYQPPAMTEGIAQTPLAVITERRLGSGEESDDEEEEESEWKTGADKETIDALKEETVVKSGYLLKKGERRKTWKKRWFVLRTAQLAYYKNEQEYKLLQLLDLRDIHAVSSVCLKRHPNTFGIVTPSRTFYIQAESPASCEAWVRDLNEYRARLKETAPVPIPVATFGPSVSAIAIPSASATNASLSPVPTAAIKTGRRPASLAPSTGALVLPVPVSASLSSASPPSPRNIQFASSDSDDCTVPADEVQRAITRDPSKAILSGYLMKCGNKRRSWRKRWFVLTSQELAYAKSHMDTKLHRKIPLDRIVDAIECTLPAKHHHSIAVATHISGTGAAAQAPFAADTGASGGAGAGNPDISHAFKIITPKRTFVLCAPSEEEEIQWLSAVRALIARRAAPHEQHHSVSGLALPSASITGGGFSASSGGVGGVPVTPRRQDGPASVDRYTSGSRTILNLGVDAPRAMAAAR